MSNTLPWRDNPNAPDILLQVYFNEKANFAGMAACAVFYGTLTVYPFSPLQFNSDYRDGLYFILPVYEHFA